MNSLQTIFTNQLTIASSNQAMPQTVYINRYKGKTKNRNIVYANSNFINDSLTNLDIEFISQDGYFLLQENDLVKIEQFFNNLNIEVITREISRDEKALEQMTEEELMEKSESCIAKLNSDARSTQYQLCKYFYHLHERMKNSNVALKDWYITLNISERRAQYMASIGKTFHNIESEHVFAFSISKLKRLIPLNNVGKFIITENMNLTCQQLDRLRAKLESKIIFSDNKEEIKEAIEAVLHEQNSIVNKTNKIDIPLSIEKNKNEPDSTISKEQINQNETQTDENKSPLITSDIDLSLIIKNITEAEKAIEIATSLIFKTENIDNGVMLIDQIELGESINNCILKLRTIMSSLHLD